MEAQVGEAATHNDAQQAEKYMENIVLPFCQNEDGYQDNVPDLLIPPSDDDDTLPDFGDDLHWLV